MDLFSGDTKIPLNVGDEKLCPDMENLPQETDGITSIVVCLIRCEFTVFLRKDTLTNPDITATKKNNMIKQLEDLFERKFLRYCDPTNTLHQLASVMIRSGMCRVKLFALNPRRLADRGIKVPQIERDMIFTNATKLLEYVNLVRGNRALEKYLWQAGTHFLWNSFLHVLIEVQHRRTGPEVDRAWQLIGVVLSKYPEMFEKNTAAVYTALGKWTLEAWNDCHAANTHEGVPRPATPDFIAAIRRCQAPLDVSSLGQKDVKDPSLVTGASAGTFNTQASRLDQVSPSDLEAFASYDFPNLVAFEMNPEEWIQWDSLVVGDGWTQTNLM